MPVFLANPTAFSAPVTVHCLRDGQFMVVVSRAATLPMLDLGSVNLLEGHSGGSCGPVGASPVFAVFQFPVSACGTTVRVGSLHRNKLIVLFGQFWVSWGTLCVSLLISPPHL